MALVERRWFRAAALAVLLGVAALAHSPAASGGFQFDDRRVIVDRPALRDLGRFAREDFLRDLLALSRPVTDLTFALDLRRSGPSPGAFHRTSVLLHLAAVVLAYLLAARLARRAGWRGRGLPLFAAAVFALHPLQSQAVSYLAQRSEVLASLLHLAALLLLLVADDAGPRRRGLLAWGAALLVFVLAMGAKVVAVTLPATFLLAAVCLRDPAADRPGGGTRWTLLLAAPFVALAAAVAVRQVAALEGGASAGFDVPGLGARAYLLTQGRVILAYLRLLAWPAGQNVDHEVETSRSLLEPPQTLLAGLALAALIALATRLVVVARRSGEPRAAAARLVGFGWLWFLATLAPTSSFVPLADPLVEHRLYLATLGIALAAGAGAGWATERLAGGRARRSAAKSPTKARARLNYGHELRNAGKPAQALAEYRQALRLASDGTVRRVHVQGSIGPLLCELGRSEEGIGVLQEALAAHPGHPDVETELAACHAWRGDAARAESVARGVLRRYPDQPHARYVLGWALMAQGDARGAREELRHALALRPDVAAAAADLGRVSERLGLAAEACAAWSHLARVGGEAERARARERMRALSCE